MSLSKRFNVLALHYSLKCTIFMHNLLLSKKVSPSNFGKWHKLFVCSKLLVACLIQGKSKGKYYIININVMTF